MYWIIGGVLFVGTIGFLGTRAFQVMIGHTNEGLYHLFNKHGH